jgi:hypothetical protein
MIVSLDARAQANPRAHRCLECASVMPVIEQFEVTSFREMPRESVQKKRSQRARCKQIGFSPTDNHNALHYAPQEVNVAREEFCLLDAQVRRLRADKLITVSNSGQASLF